MMSLEHQFALARLALVKRAGYEVVLLLCDLTVLWGALKPSRISEHNCRVSGVPAETHQPNLAQHRPRGIRSLQDVKTGRGRGESELEARTIMGGLRIAHGTRHPLGCAGEEKTGSPGDLLRRSPIIPLAGCGERGKDRGRELPNERVRG